MKRTLSLALALAICLSLAVPAFAADPKPVTITDQGAGVTVTLDGVYFTETVSVEMDGNEMDEDYYEGQRVVEELTIYHLKEGVTATAVNTGAALVHSEGAYTYYDECWPLTKQPSGWSAGELLFSAADGFTGSTPETWQTGKSWTATGSGLEAGHLYCLTVGTARAVPGAPHDHVHLVEIWCVLGDTPLLDGIEPAPEVPTVGFTDVKSGDWFYDAVQWAVEKDITTGTTATTFSPANTCTTAQILTFLWRANGSPAPKTAPDSTEYYAKAAQWAQEQGITDEFEPNTPCTRAMTVEYLWKAAGKPQSAAQPAFTDIEGDADLAKAVAWAVETGVTTGTSDTTFSPAQICNRGQIVTFLYRALAE